MTKGLEAKKALAVTQAKEFIEKERQGNSTCPDANAVKQELYKPNVVFNGGGANTNIRKNVINSAVDSVMTEILQACNDIVQDESIIARVAKLGENSIIDKKKCLTIDEIKNAAKNDTESAVGVKALFGLATPLSDNLTPDQESKLNGLIEKSKTEINACKKVLVKEPTIYKCAAYNNIHYKAIDTIHNKIKEESRKVVNGAEVNFADTIASQSKQLCAFGLEVMRQITKDSISDNGDIKEGYEVSWTSKYCYIGVDDGSLTELIGTITDNANCSPTPDFFTITVNEF